MISHRTITNTPSAYVFRNSDGSLVDVIFMTDKTVECLGRELEQKGLLSTDYTVVNAIGHEEARAAFGRQCIQREQMRRWESQMGPGKPNIPYHQFDFNAK